MRTIVLVMAVFASVLAIMGVLGLLIGDVFPSVLFIVAPTVVASIFLVTGLSTEN